MEVPKIVGMDYVPHLTNPPDISKFKKDKYKGHFLLEYGRKRRPNRQATNTTITEKQKKNEEKMKKAQIAAKRKAIKAPKYTQAECQEKLRKWVEKAPIPPIQKQTLTNISKLIPLSQRQNYPNVMDKLLEEVKVDYEKSLRAGTVDMMVLKPPEPKTDEGNGDNGGDCENVPPTETIKIQEAPWHKEYKKNQSRILNNLHVLHPALRQSLNICKDHLNNTTLANCDGFGGEAIDLDSFCGNIISECEKTEEVLMNSWFPQIAAIFTQNKQKPKADKLQHFYNSASSLLSIQLRSLMTRSILSYVEIFTDRRKLPRIEMELILRGSEICFSPSISEVSEMILSVVFEMNKLLREVPTMESWISGGSSEFVQVSLHQDFIKAALDDLKVSVDNWLKEPIECCQNIVNKFNFLIDGRAKKKIRQFIEKQPKFEDICLELQSYNKFVEQTQEISSLEYFTFIRLDCEKVRKGLGNTARDLANSLLQNIVDTYRKENESICEAFQEINRIAITAPLSTKEMIELGEYMLHVKNKRMVQLNEEIETSKGHLLYLIDVHIFSEDDIKLNTKTLRWPSNIKPVFEQNTEIVEDCKARFEDNLQKKSDWITKELVKLSLRVQELEELGEILSIQQYTYEVRMIQNKLKSIEETICWINQEEALFKFPQSSYQDVGDINTIQSGEGKMKVNIEPYARLFNTVLKWQKAQKKWTDGSFLELNAVQIETDINAFSSEMEALQKLFKSKFKQQALDGDSKYAKMNLEDSNPNNLPPPLKICALTIAQVKDFRTNIPIITCLCNPGLRARHWRQMGDVIGFDITPNSGSSLRKVLRLELTSYMVKLEAISVAATQEHALELTLKGMKAEWEHVKFSTVPYREGDQQILSSTDSIVAHLEDHMVKTHNMRGSPYFKAFEVEVCDWETQLARIQNILETWMFVQEQWLCFEPILSTADIASKMETEGRLFKEIIDVTLKFSMDAVRKNALVMDVDKSWNNVMEIVSQNPGVLAVTDSQDILTMLEKSKDTVKIINKGLNNYLEKTLHVFPRLFFLSKREVLALLSETRDPTMVQKFISHIFPGIQSLEFDELFDANAMVSNKGERIPFSCGISTKEAKGCVEKWMLKVESAMKSSVNDIILGALESIGTPTRAEWAQDWPCQGVLVAELINATNLIHEGIKGGNTAMRNVVKKYEDYQIENIKVFKASKDNSTQEIMSMLLQQDLHTKDVVKTLLDKQVVSEKDYAWKSRPRMYALESDIALEMLAVKEGYRYEYQGDCVQPVWYKTLEKTIYNFFTAFSMKYFPLLNGTFSCGKSTALIETCRLIAQNLVTRNITSVSEPKVIEKLISGAACSGSWLCLSAIDRLDNVVLSMITPWFQRLQEVLKEMGERKTLGKRKGRRNKAEDGEQNKYEIFLPNCGKLTVSRYSFLCFMVSPEYPGRHKLPTNLMAIMRPITLLRADMTPVIDCQLFAGGIDKAVSKFISKKINSFSSLWNGLLSSSKKIEMALWIRIVIKLGKLHHSNPGISLNKEIKSLIHRFLNGSLVEKDQIVAEKILDHIWGDESNLLMKQNSGTSMGNERATNSKSAADRSSNEVSEATISQHFSNLKLSQKEVQIKKVKALLSNLREGFSTILCAPTMTGKSILLQIALMVENESRAAEYQVETRKFFPKSCDLQDLFGYFDEADSSVWIDGIFTRVLRERDTDSLKPLWLVLDGPMDYKWTETIETILGVKRRMNLHSGEELHVPRNMQMIFETSSIEKVSPGLIAKCGLVVMEGNDFTWKTIFSNWFENAQDDESIMRWRRGQEELIEGLFFWLGTPLLKLVMETCRPVFTPIANGLIRHMVEYFSTCLCEAINNLKERKYLRSWIQAACVSSAIWAIGGILNASDKLKFDSKLRDILMGKSASNPLPPILNNKFDALPPAEGTVFDFVFDFKARGQWKHWNDVVKTMDVPEKMSVHVVIPTVDTARFNHIYASSLKCNRPLLLTGPQGVGKTITVWSKLLGSTDSASYRFRLLPSSNSTEFKSWLLEKLSKRKKGIYGPDGGTKGTILIDDITAPSPDEFGDVTMHEQIIELLDTNKWYDAQTGQHNVLEDISMTGIATMDIGVNQSLSEKFLSRFNLTVISDPSEDSFSKIFSTTLGLEFKERNYPPEVAGVIPSIIQSTYKVYSECRGVLLTEDENRPFENLPHAPDLRDVAKIVDGCSSLPKEAAENKKLFTRLWVHEALRYFYDRLTQQHEMDVVFNCIKGCVRAIFRENFDSAFEHLGKVDGQVTQVNLRNLLFGRYLPSESGGSQYQEVQGFDQYERIVQENIKKNNEKSPQEVVNILPIRFTLEMISHINHVITTPYGHAILFGSGGDGRATAARVSSLITGHRFFSLPICNHYDYGKWRQDLRKLVRDAGFHSQETVIYIAASQLIRHPFILKDIDSILGRGEVPGLFSTKEKNELNEFVHHHLQAAGEKITEMTPAAIYEIFIDLCRARLHLVIACTLGEQFSYSEIFRKHTSILSGSVQINFRKWPEDALKKSADYVFEEISAPRQVKKTVTKIGMDIFEEAITMATTSMETLIRDTWTTSGGHASNRVLPRGVLISPANYLRFLHTLNSVYVANNSKIEDKKVRLEKLIQKIETISEQVSDLKQESKDMEPKLEQLNETSSTKRVTMEELSAQKSEKVDNCKNEEEIVGMLKKEVDDLKSNSDRELMEVKEKVEGTKAKVSTIKAADFVALKTMKNVPAPLKLSLISACVLTEAIVVDSTSEATAKKMITDYWAASKKAAMDPLFPDKVRGLNVEDEAIKLKLPILDCYFTNQPEWDPTGAGKNLPAAELLCRWVNVIQEYYAQEEKIKPLLESFSQKQDHLKSKENALQALQSALEADEHQFELLQDEIEKIEQEKSQVSQDKETCKQKLNRGLKLLDEIKGEKETWISKVEDLNKKAENLLGDALISASLICILPPFDKISRERLKQFIDQKMEEGNISCSDTSEIVRSMVDYTCLEQWKQSGLSTDDFFLQNAIALTSTKSWPLILDPDSKSIRWINNMHRNRVVRHIQQGENEEEIASTLQKCIRNGEVAIFYDVISFDSCFDSVLTNKVVTTKHGKRYMRVRGEDIPYSDDFKLYMIYRGTSEEMMPEYELQTRCTIVDFNFTNDCMNNYFMDIVSECEMPSKRQEFLLISDREVEALNNSQKARDKIERLFGETEANLLLDNVNAVNSIFETMKELTKSDDRAAAMLNLKNELREHIDKYISAATHATSLFMAVKQLRYINQMYEYEFDWFVKVFKLSIENSNKSKIIEKRLRYLKDHLTYSLFSQVSNSLWQKDRLVFAFLLCCHLLVGEQKLEQKSLEQLVTFLHCLKSSTKQNDELTMEEKESNNKDAEDGKSDEKNKNDRCVEPKYETKPSNLDWLSEKSWNYFVKFEEEFEEVKGFTKDLGDNSSRWQMLYEAKEPDNLPLHEPWYSRLSRFQKLLVIATLRTDKLVELAYSYVSDHVGYKFVEPVTLDLGRVFSECESSQPLLFLTHGPNDAAREIRRFASDRKQKLDLFSNWDVKEGNAESILSNSRSGGNEWLMIENFEAIETKSRLLRHHSIIGEDFHNKYRLWIVTSECNDFPIIPLKRTIKLSWEQPMSMRDSMKHYFMNTVIRDSKVWAGKGGGKSDTTRQIGNERHYSRLIYCIAYFHSTLNERSAYGTRGGFSKLCNFSGHDLAMGINYLEMINQEFDSVQFPGLTELLEESTYFNIFQDPQDRALLKTLLHNSINEKVLTTNRYKFSSSADFFVPNKTLYRDYVEFVKGLPGRSDNDVLDLDPTCQITRDLDDGESFLMNACRALRHSRTAIDGSCTKNAASVKRICRRILKHLNKALQTLTKLTTSGPLKGGFGKSMSSSLSVSTATNEGSGNKESTVGDSSSNTNVEEISYSNWIWSNERDIFLGCLMLARRNMERLEKCIKGKKILDKESQAISEVLLSGFIPGYWVIVGGRTLQDEGFRKQGKNMPIETFLALTEERVCFSEMCAGSNNTDESGTAETDASGDKVDLPKLIIPMAIIQDPCRLFMAVKFNFAISNEIPVESVRFKGIFRDSFEFGVKDFVFLGDDQDDPTVWLERFKQIEEKSKEYVIALSGLILQGVNWDYRRMALVDRKVSLPNDFDIKIAYIYPVIIDSVEEEMSNEEGSQSKNEESGDNKGKLYQCPLYGTKDRHYSDTESSLVTHIWLETDVSTETLLKRGAMLAINT